MARLETKRYDVKLDSFLRRTLPSEEYERVSASEPCVVLSPDDKRVHRHVILGHHSLYLTEFPPKSLKTAVHLRDVQSVRMVDDLPDFLSGKEQEDTVHVQIRYSRPHREGSFTRDKSPAILKKLRSGGGTSPLLSASNTSSSLDFKTFQASNSRGSSLSLSSSASPGLQHRTRTSSLNPNPNQDSLVDPKHNYSAVPSSPSRSTRSHTVPAIALKSVSPSPRSKSQQQYRRSMFDSDRLGSTKSLQSTAVSGLARSTNSVYKASSRSDSLKLRAAKLHGSTPDFLSLARRSALDRDAEHGSSSLSLASSERGSVSSLVLKESSASDTGEYALMDIYILKHTTDFYHQLCVTWDNFKMERTLTGNIPVKTSHSSVSHGHFSQHFCTLKQELLSAHTLESSAHLAQELSTACQKYFVIKRLFWEDSELFEFCTGKLQSQFTSLRGEEHSGNRADEIEYTLILMDLLYQTLKETHFFSKKLIVLTRSSGQLLLSLATVVVSLLPKYKSGDKQLEGFDGELTEKASAILYELVQVTQQARWPQSVKTEASITWLFASLSALPAMKDLCARLVFYIAAGIGKSSLVHIEPSSQTQVSLYHAAYLLSSMATNSPAILELMRSQLKEEFRYFISTTRAKEKLPASNLLSKDTLECLQSCKRKVLQS